MKLTLIAAMLAGCSAGGSQQPPHAAQSSWINANTISTHTRSVAGNQITDFNQYVAYLKQTGRFPQLTATFDEQRDQAHFPLFVDYLKYQAQQKGISDAVIEAGLSNVYFIARAVKADKNQLEKKITLADYLNRVLSQQRYQQAKTEFNRNKTRLKQVEKQSGVPANFIIALWGLESAFGKIQGKEDVISAVATLAYEGRRETFFTQEVMSALTVLEKGYIARDKMKGSWAGAMGQCQFMPSSLLSYGADGDGDGQIDIWSNRNDVFASIANYLFTIGWDKNATWGHKVSVPSTFNHQLEGTAVEKAKTVAQWQKLGVKFAAKQNSLPQAQQQAWLILPDDNLQSAYLVYDNFRTLMHWNRSYYFGISVGMLADSLNTTQP